MKYFILKITYVSGGNYNHYGYATDLPSQEDANSLAKNIAKAKGEEVKSVSVVPITEAEYKAAIGEKKGPFL